MHEDLVKKLRYCGNAISCLYCPYREGCGGSKEDLTQAADVIEELSATISKMEKATRWITVAERKPKTDDIVIVAIHDDSGDTPYDVTNVGFYLDVFPLGIWVVENERCNYVTYWMPLPEPPEEET